MSPSNPDSGSFTSMRRTGAAATRSRSTRTCPASAPIRTSWLKAMAAGSTWRPCGSGPARRAGQAQRLADVRTKLRAQRAGQFVLSITCHAIGPSALKTGELIAFLDLVAYQPQPGSRRRIGRRGVAAPTPAAHPVARTPSENGWSFEFEAIPLSPPMRGTSPPLVGSFTGCIADTASVSPPRPARWKPRQPDTAGTCRS